VADLIDWRLIKTHRVRCFSGAELFNVESVDQIRNPVKVGFNSAAVRQVFRRIQQGVYRGVELAAGSGKVTLKVKLFAGVEMLIGALDALVRFRGMDCRTLLRRRRQVLVNEGSCRSGRRGEDCACCVGCRPCRTRRQLQTTKNQRGKDCSQKCGSVSGHHSIRKSNGFQIL
jgi:hypothetical protein